MALPLEKVLHAPASTFAAWRILLCTGDDESAVQDAARALVARALGTGDSQFRLLDADAGQRDLALAHVATPPLGGGAPVLRLRGVGDRSAKLLADAIAVAGEGLIVAEGVGLTGRSTALKLVEGRRHGQVVTCGRDGADAVRSALAGLGRSVDPAALRVAGALAAAPGWGMFPAQLALFAQDGAALETEGVMACAGQGGSETDLDGLWAAALAGDPAASGLAQAALADGVAPVSVMRAGLMAVHRMRSLSSGSGVSAWMPRPLEAKLRDAARHWPPNAAQLGAWLSRAEQDCKTGRMHPSLVVLALIAAVAARARGVPGQPGIRSRTRPSS